MNEIKLQHKDQWNFIYKGFYCEIQHWGVDPKSEYKPEGTWCSYFTILEKQLPNDFEKLLAKSYKTKYQSMPRMWKSWDIERLFKMHGGVTYYEVLRDQYNGKKVGVKVGCDYAHIWDDNHSYNETFVAVELRESVDKFTAMFPDYLVWRNTDGKYVKPENPGLTTTE